MTQGVPKTNGVREHGVVPATFSVVDSSGGEQLRQTVHFNPASLQYSLSNTLDQGQGGTSTQYVSKTTASLTMDLVFDTTHTGQDVRVATEKMQGLLKAEGPPGRQVPPRVKFAWGTYSFTGMVEQYKETIEFFSAEGVPLRTGINLTLKSEDVEALFTPGSYPTPAADRNAPASQVALAPAATPPAPGQPPAPGGAAGLANALGDPRAARGIAAANGEDSLRFSSGAALAVGGGVQLQAAAAFSVGASAGFGIGGGAGLGLGGSAGAGLGLSAGAGLSVGGGLSAGAGLSVGAGLGAGASAGVGLSAGASASAGFGGLRSGAGASFSMPSASAVLALGSAPVAAAGAQFSLGGRAQAAAGASFLADVGAAGASGEARAGARLTFER